MIRRNLLLALLTLTTLRCGYALVGRGNMLDPSIKSVHIPTLQNRTTRSEIEQRLTQSIGEEMVSRGRMRLVSEEKGADAVLRGSINSFNLTPVSFVQGRATQYQISITATIELIDRREEEKVIWKNDQYRFVESYEISPGAVDAFDQEDRAIREIAVRFAQSLVSTLLEGF